MEENDKIIIEETIKILDKVRGKMVTAAVEHLKKALQIKLEAKEIQKAASHLNSITRQYLKTKQNQIDKERSGEDVK